MGGRLPQKQLSMEEAIRSYTYESAYAEFAEKEKGTVEVGKLADLVLHSTDLLTIKPAEVLKPEAVYTIFKGRVICRAK